MLEAGGVRAIHSLQEAPRSSCRSVIGLESRAKLRRSVSGRSHRVVDGALRLWGFYGSGRDDAEGAEMVAQRHWRMRWL